MDIEQRKNIERQIVDRLVTDILAVGHNITVWDANGEPAIYRSTDKAAIIAATGAVDEDTLLVRDGRHNRVGSITLIYGNSGYDVIANHSFALDDLLKGAYELAEQLETEYWTIKNKYVDPDPQTATGG